MQNGVETTSKSSGLFGIVHSITTFWVRCHRRHAIAPPGIDRNANAIRR